MNKAILFGRLAHTPELKATPSGAKVATASLATNHVYYDKNKQKVEETDWHNLVIWGQTAETMAQWCKGGDQILVHGRIVTRSWEDKDGGPKRYRTEIIVERFEFGAKNMNRDDRQEAPADKPEAQGGHPDLPEYPEEDINPEDIPF